MPTKKKTLLSLLRERPTGYTNLPDSVWDGAKATVKACRDIDGLLQEIKQSCANAVCEADEINTADAVNAIIAFIALDELLFAGAELPKDWQGKRE